MTRRPTTKAGIVAAIGGLLVAVGTTAQAGWLFVLAAGVLALVASSVLTRHRLATASVTRSVPARVRVGDNVRVELAVHNPTDRRLPVMRVDDPFPAFEDVAVACESVPARSSATAVIERVAVRRGVFDGGAATLSTAAPFGVIRTRAAVDVPSRIIVHPQLVDVSAHVLPETPAQTADDAVAVDRSGLGDVFAGVRDYRPGDQRRWIHWRTTARTGRLAVREHEEPARSPVVILVDGLPDGHLGDDMATAAASFGLRALDEGRPVHCIGDGRFGEVAENVTALQALDWAAALEPSQSPAGRAVDAAFRRWGRRCSFVVIGADAASVDAVVSHARRRAAGAVGVHVTCPHAENETA